MHLPYIRTITHGTSIFTMFGSQCILYIMYTAHINMYVSFMSINNFVFYINCCAQAQTTNWKLLSNEISPLCLRNQINYCSFMIEYVPSKCLSYNLEVMANRGYTKYRAQKWYKLLCATNFGQYFMQNILK